MKEGLVAFRSYRPEEYEIEVDGRKRRKRALVIAVANSSQYGNNARIAPLASLQDGLLDLVTIEDVSLISAVPMLVRLFNGTLHRSRRATVEQGAHITIRREREGPAHLDGEPVMLPAELDIRVLPRSLKVLVPAGSARI